MEQQQTRDPLGAFLPGARLRLAPPGIGPLAGLELAVKDIFDIEGEVTGCGNPDWRQTHDPAERTAAAVQALLDAGAEVVGKTITDELAYSLNGQNWHYGTPTNPNAPGRITGGSSCGSASATAGGLCDLALGSDTGGSVRIPASYCGLYGLRPSHGRISLDGVMPLAPSFDTVGWFARDAGMLLRAGAVLLGPDAVEEAAFARLYRIDDAFALAEPEVTAALAPYVERLEQRLAKAEPLVAGEPGGGLQDWMLRFRRIQGREIWQVHGAWIEAVQPKFGPEIQERFDWARTIGAEEAETAAAARRELTARFDGLLAPDHLVVLPTAPGIAPKVSAGAEDLREHRSRVLALTSIAGLTGLPQVSLPLASVAGCPVGLSLIAPRGRDLALLRFAESFCRSLP
jgi:amidase